MVRTDITKTLYKYKIRDYNINSGLLPSTGKFGNLFSSFLGQTAGKTLSIYNNIFNMIDKSYSIQEIQDYTKRDVNKKSKLSVKLPFGKNLQTRICGLDALNYSGFFDREIELYSTLVKDLKKNEQNLENLLSNIEEVGKNNMTKYKMLLKGKRDAIYDFGVLMGLKDNSYRLKKLKKNMQPTVANYFDNIISRHNGKFGVSWPLPLKKFSKSILDGLLNDSISYIIQNNINTDHGFLLPKESNYERTLNNIKEAFHKISDSGKIKPFKVFSTATSFLYSMNAYAQGPHVGITKPSFEEILLNSVLAAIPAVFVSSIEPKSLENKLDDFIEKSDNEECKELLVLLDMHYQEAKLLTGAFLWIILSGGSLIASIQ